MSLHDLYHQYRDRVQFLMVYIREAHPVDGWWLGGGITGVVTKAIGFTAATDVYDPKTTEERQAVAGRCQSELKYEIPICVDTIDNVVNTAYAAHPTRLYLIGKDGRVVYAGRLGPFGFKPDELGEAIEKYLAAGQSKE
ncbi:MAG: hypothetical protein HYX91_06045 [Chloroflexi bacterium]|nr:hypothetical protein [Chloroflexota bacterium]